MEAEDDASITTVDLNKGTGRSLGLTLRVGDGSTRVRCGLPLVELLFQLLLLTGVWNIH